jgi:hypothetical protein
LFKVNCIQIMEHLFIKKYNEYTVLQKGFRSLSVYRIYLNEQNGPSQRMYRN